jgi:hypothetical protein
VRKHAFRECGKATANPFAFSGGTTINVTPNLHNVIVITVIACLGILALRMAAKTQAGGLPVLGSVLKTAATV